MSPRRRAAFASVLLFLLTCPVHADPAAPTDASAAAATEAPSFAGLDPGRPCSLWRDAACGDDGGGRSPWWDNLSIFGGLDGAKQPEDLGVNAHFGMRGAVNWGAPILESYGVGVQAGTALNYSNNAVRVLKSVDGTHDDLQSFTTVGLFQRGAAGVNWGVVYDFRHDDYYENLDFGQWRGQAGYEVTANDELGVWGALRGYGQGAGVGGQSFDLRPITQGDVFWRHVWENDIVTRFWVGMAEGHGRFLLVAPGESPVRHPLAFGAELYVPLTDRLAIFGEANFITPNDTGTVDATLGLAFYPGAGARRAPRSRFAPLLPLGNNASFAVDLRQ